MTICIFLRPELRIREIAQIYADQLSEIVPTSLTLGDDALAHITLVHLDGVDDRVDEVWETASAYLDGAYDIEGPFYLSAIPFPDGSGHNFVRVELSRTDAMHDAQQKMIVLAERFGAKITNLAGPAWRPHVTLAVTDRLPEQLPQLPEIVDAPSWVATPALGAIGEFRHVDKLLRER